MIRKSHSPFPSLGLARKERMANCFRISTVVATSPIVTAPAIDHLKETLKSLDHVKELAESPVFIVFDEPKNGKRNRAYEEYKRNVARFCSKKENHILLGVPNWSHLSGALERAIREVDTEFIFVQQHDLPIVRSFDLDAILACLSGEKDVKTIRLNARANRAVGWDNNPLFGEFENAFLPLSKTGCWSDWSHITTKSYYEDLVLPETSGRRDFIENVLNPKMKSAKGEKLRLAHQKYGTYIYGAPEESAVTKHLDARGRAGYWKKRKSYRYYKVVQDFLNDLGFQESIIDVGCCSTPVAQFGSFARRFAIDSMPFPPFVGVDCSVADWLKFDADYYSVATCLQVLEHLETEVAKEFALKLFNHSVHTVISVPYLWKKGACSSHIQDPINLRKFFNIVGRDPKRFEIVEDNGFKRLVALFENDGPGVEADRSFRGSCQTRKTGSVPARSLSSVVKVPSKSQSYRVGLINQILQKKQLPAYLEIGCDNDRTFSRVNAHVKVGVDPVSGGNIRKTSDDFFSSNMQRFDVVFIDGLHEEKQVLRDVDNSLKVLNPEGVVLIHDCLPFSRLTQQRDRLCSRWNGDVWRALLALRQRWNCDSVVVSEDTGIGIVLGRNRTSVAETLEGEIDFEDLSSFLNIISPDEVPSFINKQPRRGRIRSTWFKHFIITRFNVGKIDEDWLSHRFEFFERFTAPSIAEQVQQRFEWVIQADERTPEPFRSRLSKIAELSYAKVIWVRPGKRNLNISPQVIQDVKESIGDETHIVSSRLDSDDALMRDYSLLVQRALLPERGPEFLSFPTGSQWVSGKTKNFRYKCNPFQTYVEEVSETPRLAYHCNHVNSEKSCKVRELESKQPMWLQVIHDHNLINKSRF